MKRILSAMICVLLLISMAACGGKTPAPVDVDISKLADDMLEALAPQGEMLEITDATVDNYYSMGDLVKEYKIYASSMWIAEEVAVLRLSDAGKTKEGKAIVEARIKDLKNSFDNYLPEEFASMNENALVLTKGDIVCFVVGLGPGRDAAKAVFDKAVG